MNLYNNKANPIRCKECNEHMNEDDERWNGLGTVYCRECVWNPFHTAQADMTDATDKFREAEKVAKERLKEKRDAESDWSEGDKIDAARTNFEEDSGSTQDETAHYRCS